jgi:hypothetical protein
LTPHPNSDVSKLSNRDIQRIIRQWVTEKPFVEIARYFPISRQRVYPLINQYREAGKYPFLLQSGRKPQLIDERMEKMIIETPQTNPIGPTQLISIIKKKKLK